MSVRIRCPECGITLVLRGDRETILAGGYARRALEDHWKEEHESDCPSVQPLD